MMWSFGALLELGDRARLEEQLKTKFSHLDLPECTKGPNDSIFDYRVDENGTCMCVGVLVYVCLCVFICVCMCLYILLAQERFLLIGKYFLHVNLYNNSKERYSNVGNTCVNGSI